MYIYTQVKGEIHQVKYDSNLDHANKIHEDCRIRIIRCLLMYLD